MRIGGIASGIDTESMVKQLMQAERIRVDKFLQQEQRLKWRQEAYQSINRDMANFILNSRRNLGLVSTTNSGLMVNRSVNSLDWVKRTSSSNENVVKATASANAMSGTHTVKVKQLAETARFTSGNLTDYLEEGKFTEGGTFEIRTANGTVRIEVVAGTTTINQLVNQINGAQDVTTNKSLGLRAAYDPAVGKLMISTRETGANQLIAMEEVLGSFASDVLGMSTSDAIGGKDAILWFNNQPGDEEDWNNNVGAITKSTNDFSVFGINLQLQAAQGKDDAPITLRVDTNTEGIMEKVKSFVDSYNEMIDKINELTKQKFYRDFQPLTKEQKEAMNEKDIEAWEEKAKSGLLRNDEALSRMIQAMRNNLYKGVEGIAGSFKHITDIGITTSRNYQDGGKLEINEQKLREAIGQDPEGVMDLLFKTSSRSVPAPKSGETATERETRLQQEGLRQSETGLIHRIYEDMIKGMKEVVRRSGPGADGALFRNVQSNILIDFVTSGSISVLDRDLSSLNRRIAQEERLLAGREDRYWRQFTAMEKAMTEMNKQSGWLMAQLGMGQ